MLPTRNVIENVVCVNCRYMCCHKKNVLWTAVASLLYEVYSIQLNGTGKVLQKFTFNMCLWYATLHTSTWPSFRVVVFEWTKFFSQDQWNRDAEKKKIPLFSHLWCQLCALSTPNNLCPQVNLWSLGFYLLRIAAFLNMSCLFTTWDKYLQV